MGININCLVIFRINNRKFFNNNYCQIVNRLIKYKSETEFIIDCVCLRIINDSIFGSSVTVKLLKYLF